MCFVSKNCLVVLNASILNRGIFCLQPYALFAMQQFVSRSMTTKNLYIEMLKSCVKSRFIVKTFTFTEWLDRLVEKQ